ncbi:LysR family hydrogen peroxide-inducible transcriptional activator [Hymenobacter luteus]|uniref:LysR family hydrogen peroxide-inducible transcriptional activator n=2 Tax=Hymenobacter TaxID=89966 RepID=A0A7W9SZW1_9BACT|nr:MULTISPECIES: LysR substrate-binding domain-containing protein [Hymenobacter]MBB4599577.1 LysR family hydrogen peroxide-inducible transcriptional activator [Hymenobacter latericoloratus]MBB6058113.1 LysR family hydrogen peroxide-inducible transcriptional activator [Hymenobacter luteus]
MNIQQLEYVVALDTHRQFVLAAEKCHVTQPTLSMQLQKLEEELGVLLFDRTTKGVQPTAVGEKVVQQARQVLREVKQLREVVQVEKGELVGELRLGIIPTLAPYLVPLFLVELVERYPQLRVQVQELQSAQIIQQLKDNQLDVGLLVTPLDDRQLREVPVLEEPFLGYISESHELYAQPTISPQDMGAPGLWLLQQGHCFRHQVLNICAPAPAATSRPFTYESGSIETLKELVRHNHGYTLVPELSVLPELNNPMVKRFEAPEPVREISLVVHQGFVRLPLLETLRELILRKVPERLQAGKAKQKIRWR